MRFFINIIKVLLFLGVGTALFIIPYEKFQIWFPQAPKVAVVKSGRDCQLAVWNYNYGINVI